MVTSKFRDGAEQRFPSGGCCVAGKLNEDREMGRRQGRLHPKTAEIAGLSQESGRNGKISPRAERPARSANWQIVSAPFRLCHALLSACPAISARGSLPSSAQGSFSLSTRSPQGKRCPPYGLSCSLLSSRQRSWIHVPSTHSIPGDCAFWTSEPARGGSVLACSTTSLSALIGRTRNDPARTWATRSGTPWRSPSPPLSVGPHTLQATRRSLGVLIRRIYTRRPR